MENNENNKVKPGLLRDSDNPNTASARIQTLVGTAVLAAIVIVLQVFASGIRIGPFTPTLSLIPIIIGAIVYGPVTGAVLGAIFGIIVVIAVISGAEPFSLLMFNQNPAATVITCLLKGAAAGYLSGLLYQVLKKKKIVNIVSASVIAPVANTGIFCIAMLTIFRNLWAESTGGQNPFVFLLITFVGMNFLFELAFDIVLIPVIMRIISAIRKTTVK